jgi:hypothetical protein
VRSASVYRINGSSSNSIGKTVWPVINSNVVARMIDVCRTNVDAETRNLSCMVSYNIRNYYINEVQYQYNGKIGDTLEVIFEGNDVFSETNLDLLNQTENRLFYLPFFQSMFCF